MTEQERIELLKKVAKACEKAGIKAEFIDDLIDTGMPIHVQLITNFGTPPFDFEINCELSLEPYTPSLINDAPACFIMLDAMEKAGYVGELKTIIDEEATVTGYQFDFFYLHAILRLFLQFKGETRAEVISRAFIAVFGLERMIINE